MNWTLLDVQSLDRKTMIRSERAPRKPEVVFLWVQSLCVDAIKQGVLDIPAPLLTRSFQDLGTGMLNYHEAITISDGAHAVPALGSD